MTRFAALILAVSPFIRAGAQRPAPGAPIDLSAFAFARAIPPGDGLTVVALDAAALAHSHVDDIRIVDSRRRQIPYVIERVEELLELKLPTLEATSAQPSLEQPLPGRATKRTWYRARLAYAGLPDAVLRLRTNERIFRRTIAVVTTQAARDAQYDPTPRIDSESWSHSDPATAAPALDIVLPARLASDSLFVLVDDGDNQKLSISEAAVRLPTQRLRFFRDSGAALRLVYGSADLAAPRYDLALVADRLRDSSATPATLGPELALQRETGRVPRVVFWAVLAVTVLVLLALIARLVRGGAEDAAQP